jgi:signal transduction histidine kinase
MERASNISSHRDILAMTAHELRNTLSPLSSAMELLATQDPERRAWALGIAKRQLSCIRQLVSDMGQASLADDDLPQLITRERVLLQELLEECVAACAPMFSKRDQSVSISLEAQPLWSHLDAARFTQVFSNLLTNASKYTHPGGHISVACKKDDSGWAEVDIADDGAGILPENLPRLFDRFYREDRLKAAAPGLGIGLSVVRALVHAHGGYVRAYSDGPGTGSRFVVRLPLHSQFLAAS